MIPRLQIYQQVLLSRRVSRIQYFSQAPTLAASTATSQAKFDFDNSLIVTNSCANRIKALRETNHNDRMYLRLAVEGGGCSGFQYIFKMEDSPVTEEDKSFEKDGAKVVVDTISFELVKGSTIDYVQEMMKSAFTVANNPQSEKACGCGSSFAVKNFSSNPALD